LERVSLVKQRYLDASITQQELSRAFCKAGIRKKAVRLLKKSTAVNPKDPSDWYMETRSLMMHAFSQGRPLVYVDESHFVATNYEHKAYMPKREHLELNDHATNTARVTLVMAVSEVGRVLAYFIKLDFKSQFMELQG
jgi:hypothetical protein